MSCWSPIPRFALKWIEQDMRVYDELLKSVIFIGVESPNGAFTPLGTGFLCGIDVEGEETRIPFLVTAAHVVKQIAGDKISIRLNRRNGGAEILRVSKEGLVQHGDLKNDIALLPVANLFEIYDVLMWRLDRKREEKVRETWNPSVGDEVTTIGLYTSHYGLARNIPVVRIGHIAMMPGEPVRTDAGYVEAYLIETKSIAGLSGSPVHLQIPRVRINPDNGHLQILNEEVSILLGVMIGYHVVESAEDQIAVPQFQDSNFKQTGGITAENNTGFAVVIPITRVQEIMESDLMKGTIKLAHEIAKHRFRPASSASASLRAAENKPDGPNPDHLEDFTALLSAAAKVQSPKDRT